MEHAAPAEAAESEDQLIEPRKAPVSAPGAQHRSSPSATCLARTTCLRQVLLLGLVFVIGRMSVDVVTVTGTAPNQPDVFVSFAVGLVTNRSRADVLSGVQAAEAAKALAPASPAVAGSRTASAAGVAPPAGAAAAASASSPAASAASRGSHAKGTALAATLPPPMYFQDDVSACPFEKHHRQLHIPPDFNCTHPKMVHWFRRLPDRLVRNPYEPACWDTRHRCGPFDCSRKCVQRDPFMMELIKKWTPEVPSDTKILIFQYGKVASSSIVMGFKLHADLVAAHAHAPEHVEAWLAGKATGIPTNQQGFALSEEWSLKPGDRCFIFTMTRSHFTRDPSEFFENLIAAGHPYAYPTMEKPWNRARVTKLLHSNLSALVEHYQRKHPQVTAYYSTWWSQIFRKATGVDILSTPFDFEEKVSVVKGERCTAVVLRYEDIRHWEAPIRKLFPRFRMKRENAASDKWYSDVYKDFIKAVKYSKEEFEAICNTETEKYFYKGTAGSRCPKTA